MNTRLVRSASGRGLWAITTGPGPETPNGTRFLVLGDQFFVGEVGVGWTGERTGMPNVVTAARQSNRDPLPLERA